VKIEELSGIRIPVECEATWDMNGKDWTWLNVHITNISFTTGN
jgi:hypothetical protein